MGAPSAQFVRRYRQSAPPLAFTLDGVAKTGRLGDTVLTAILSVGGSVRHTEFTGEPRAGFCLIGACQDCMVLTPQGQRLRACTTLLEDGMSFLTRPAGEGRAP